MAQDEGLSNNLGNSSSDSSHEQVADLATLQEAKADKSFVSVIEEQPFHASSSPVRQSVLNWLLAILTIATYCLTVCYAFGTTNLRYLSFTSLDPSRTLALLRALSEVTAFLIGILISVCMERGLWMLIRRTDGVFLPTFLALHPASGFGAWIQLILKNAGGGRFLSWFNIILALVLRAVGVALLSQVDVRVFFDNHSTFPVSSGVGDFNNTFVSDWIDIAPSYMANDFPALLQNKQASWPVDVLGSTNSSCLSDPFTSDVCGSGYFLHGGLKLVAPWPTENTSIPNAPIYTLNSVRGLQLDFTKLAPSTNFDTENDCIILGDNTAALLICMSQNAPNAVNAKYLPCPFGTIGACLDDTSWHSPNSMSAVMTCNIRSGTVHYSRANLSALAVSDLSPPSACSISAAELLSVYNTTLGNSSSLSGTSHGEKEFIKFVSNYLAIAETSFSVVYSTIQSLHNLMAMPLYYYQPSYMSPFTMAPSVDKVLENLPQGQGLYSTASLSTGYYGLHVAPWCALLYTIVMGFIIIGCLAVLLLGSLSKTADGIPDTTVWPYVDFTADCHIEEDVAAAVDGDTTNTSTKRLTQRLKSTRGRGAQGRFLKTLRVKMNKKMD